MNEFETKMRDDKIDQALRRHFQSEMPHPWPAFVAPEQKVVRPLRSTRSWLGRVAVAAAVAGLFVGCWSLMQLFPGAGTTDGGIVQERPIASKPGVTERLTPGGKNATEPEEGMGRVEKIQLP